MKRHETREAWLIEAAKRLNDWIDSDTDLAPSEHVLVSIGWPRRDRGGKVIGQCYTKKSGRDKAHHIFVSPMLENPRAILAVVAHELIHAADDCKHAHAKDFRRAWKALGFVGKPTESTPGDVLAEQLDSLAQQLGELPHTQLVPTGTVAKKQTTRMHKIICNECGAVARMAQQWIDLGLPSHCDTEMEVE